MKAIASQLKAGSETSIMMFMLGTKLRLRVPTGFCHTFVRHSSGTVSKQDWDYNNDPQLGPIKVPGYSKPLDHPYINYIEVPQGFAHGLSSWTQEKRNFVREIHMLRAMDALTDKHRWDSKVFDEVILSKWKAEAMVMPGRLISEKAWTWIVKELRWKAVEHWRTGYVTTLDTDSSIVKSDGTRISESLRQEMIENVKPLMEINERERDWHPGSAGKVLNLVHPSMYPLVYGRTRLLTDRALDLTNYLDGKPDDGVVLDDPTAPEEANTGPISGRNQGEVLEPRLWSTKFQWLPCDVEFVGNSGNEVKIMSYINNLHPTKHKELYGTIEKVISASIPAWNKVLLWNMLDFTRTWKSRSSHRIDYRGEIEQTPEPPDGLLNILQDIPHKDKQYEIQTIEQVKTFLSMPENADRLPLPFPEHPWRTPFDPSFSEGWHYSVELEDMLYDKWRDIRVTKHPEPGGVEDFGKWKRARQGRRSTALEETFRKSGLQVIVKLSSIELTPEKPGYSGGNWHLEGKMNEHIVATSIYYYDVENTTESRIEFRQEAILDHTLDVEYDAGNHGPLEDAYGACELYDCPAVQDIGSAVTKQGRLLVFPNVVQHRVKPFKLQDPTKPGHRRFLVIWLVDPHFRIISTKNVPPQQWDWWYDQDSSDGVQPDSDKRPMKRDEAEKWRIQLMEERTAVMTTVESHFDFYSFCEH